jgi:hypothetical protein
VLASPSSLLVVVVLVCTLDVEPSRAVARRRPLRPDRERLVALAAEL